ncbi:MAG TPA: hypothetical protein VE954_32030 [Oligoflexus sp.]|uniref:hypothetical protein n=1 Tax=Oligoflexus sp. TaxID=1971216 RepID=UPI002D41FD51|nr:hypothetical protein [Oligoflexus sp.]HYX37755.1 hypothetical protein [Oligoflexus sp.]
MKRLCLMGTLTFSAICFGGNEQGGFGKDSQSLDAEEKSAGGASRASGDSMRREIMTYGCRYLVLEKMCSTPDMGFTDSPREEEDGLRRPL